MQYWLFAAGAVVLIWTWLLVRKGYVTGWERLEESRRRLEEQATELAIVAEEVLADVSARTERLQELIAQADATLAKQPATAARPAPQPERDGDADAIPPALALVAALEAAAADAPAPAAAAAAAAPTAPPAAQARQAPPASPPTRAPASPPASPPAGHQAVWDLAEQGLDVTDIARRLQRTKGEVELILGLRKLG